MVVCHCHNINEKAIYQAAANGVTNYSHLKAELKVGTCCGQCEGFARETLNNALKPAGELHLQYT